MGTQADVFSISLSLDICRFDHSCRNSRLMLGRFELLAGLRIAIDMAMPRQPRMFISGMTQHVMQRGNNRTDMFRCPFDYGVFVHLVREASLRFAVQVHAYVLMTNHVHLMMTPPSREALSRAMQSVGRRYVRYFNDRYTRTGTLFEGRYRSVLVDAESYWITCMRYVELNPVRAGLVDHPAQYRWSSYRAHANGTPDGLLVDHPVYHGLGNTTLERCRSWTAICAQGTPLAELDELRRMIRTGQVRNKIVFPDVPVAAVAAGSES